MQNVKVLWGIIAVLLIAVGILSFAILNKTLHLSTAKPGLEPPQVTDPERTLASIGEKKIKLYDLEQQLLHKQGKEMLAQMIDQEVIRREAEALGIEVSEPEVQQEIERMQQGYENENAFFKAMEEQLGLTKNELLADVRNKLMTDHVLIQGITINDATVEEYIRTHPDEFKAMVQLRLEQIVTANKEQAQKVLDDLAKGKDFAQVARERSLDDASRDTGGDMGWIEEDDPFVPVPVMNAAKLLKSGEISKPIVVNGQYAILRVRDRKSQSKGNVETVREQVKRELALREAPPLNEVLQKLRQKWKVNQEKLEF